MTKPYQPKTGRACSCKPGIQRDNCPACEGTGMMIDFAAIRARARLHDHVDVIGPHADAVMARLEKEAAP